MGAQRQHPPAPVTDPNRVAVERRIARTFHLLHGTSPVGTPEKLLTMAKSIVRLRAARAAHPRPTRRN